MSFSLVVRSFAVGFGVFWDEILGLAGHSIRFNLPFVNSPLFATRYQIFENESLITIHDLIGQDSREFDSYTQVTFETIPVKPLIVNDIKLRLSRVKETVEILLMNQDEAYANEIVGESEKIKLACQKVIE